MVSAALERHATDARHHVALQGDDTCWTYGDLVSRVDKIAKHLRSDHALDAGRALVSGTSQADILATVLGTWAAGLSAVVVHSRATPADIEDLVRSTAPTLALGLPQRRDTSGLHQAGCAGDCLHVDHADRSASLENECLVLQTSGTSGHARAVSIDGLARAACVRALIGAYQMTPATRMLLTVPVVHSSGLTFSVAHLIAGSTIVLPDRFDTQHLVHALGAHRPTVALCVPTTVRRLSQAENPGSLQRTICMGAPLPPPDRITLFDTFPELELIEYYGCTEHPHIAWRHTDNDASARAALELFDGVDARIVDHNGANVPHDVSGTIQIQGPFMMNGYLCGPHELEAAPEWFTTGDRGSRSGRSLSVEGRADDVILVGGVNVSPSEVEARIRSLPGVRECAVVGVPDAEYGNVIHAFYEADEELSDDDVAAHCRSTLTRTKVPRSYHRIHTVPVTATGKPRRALLRERVARAGDRGPE